MKRQLVKEINTNSKQNKLQRFKRKSAQVKIGKKRLDVFGFYRNDFVLIPLVKNGACLLDEEDDPVLRWARTQKPFKLSWLTRLEFGLLPKIDKLHLASVVFLVYAVVSLVMKA